MTWDDVVFGAFMYVVGAVATVIVAGLVAESENGGVRKWWATIAALWLIWPLAWVGGVLYAIGYACIATTRYMWRLRNTTP